MRVPDAVKTKLGSAQGKELLAALEKTNAGEIVPMPGNAGVLLSVNLNLGTPPDPTRGLPDQPSEERKKEIEKNMPANIRVSQRVKKKLKRFPGPEIRYEEIRGMLLFVNVFGGTAQQIVDLLQWTEFNDAMFNKPHTSEVPFTQDLRDFRREIGI